MLQIKYRKTLFFVSSQTITARCYSNIYLGTFAWYYTVKFEHRYRSNTAVSHRVLLLILHRIVNKNSNYKSFL